MALTTTETLNQSQDFSLVEKNIPVDETEVTESSYDSAVFEVVPVSAFDLINADRVAANLKPIKSSVPLDKLAQKLVNRIAELEDVGKALVPMKTLQFLMKSGYVAQNVAEGFTLKDMHNDLMDEGLGSRNNVLSKTFKACGVATAKNEASGKIYMVQLFRGKKNNV